ncbi:MAG: galactokinase [Oscillospiraceae bacterium]|nr:galactokinase [Oscillospiraceae bacterium]
MAQLKETLKRLYGEEALEQQLKRYENAERAFAETFGVSVEPMIFSASGRTEIGGNHTDHNRGKVLAAAVGLDVIAYVIPTRENVITVQSEGFPRDDVKLDVLEPVEAELNSSAALIRGVAAGFVKEGLKIGGFEAYTTSNVLKGSGISSSAAFEVLIGTILSHLYNDGNVSAVKIAQIAQYAENRFFGKPSGLLDQMASSVGGFITIDFKDTANPVIESISYDFASSGYSLCVVDTKGNHADLTPEYAAIPQEMKAVAEYFGKKELRDIDKGQVMENAADIRAKLGDRAFLRAMHFFDENVRVEREAAALKAGNINEFFKNVNESGNSSYKYLQNICAPKNPSEQGLSVGLYAAENVLEGRGACRVHGGGFAGTIQAFVPNDKLDTFTDTMDNLFGKGSCHKLYIRPCGGVKVK